MTIQWLKNFVSGLNIVDFISNPVKLYCDNASVVFYPKNEKGSSSSKYITSNYVVSIRLKKGIQLLSIYHLMTKSLAPRFFNEHVISIGMLSSFDVLR